MSPQLTLQTPLELAPAEVPHYLEQLWSPEQQGSTGTGANTFCLLIWQPAWACLLYTSPSPRDQRGSRMPSSA